jgi:hypothetical protein
MTFAVKLKKSEIITITAQKLCTLTITNIALGPHEKVVPLSFRMPISTFSPRRARR